MTKYALPLLALLAAACASPVSGADGGAFAAPDASCTSGCAPARCEMGQVVCSRGTLPEYCAAPMCGTTSSIAMCRASASAPTVVILCLPIG